jgi:hypothetical protein
VRLRLWGLLFCILILAGCGAGNGGAGGGNPPPTQGLIDPSGNWAIVATDPGGTQFGVAGVFDLSATNGAETGGTIIANNLKPIDLPLGASNGSAPPQFMCGSSDYSTPGSLQLSSGSLQNNDNLQGEISFPSGLGGFAFTATLASNAQSFTGTYSNMPGCVGIESTGTISGTQVPSLTGGWSGHLQACTSNGQACTPVQGTSAEPINFALTQDNATATVSGNYIAASVYADLQGGSITTIGALGQFPNNYVSGYSVQFHLTDNISGFSGVVVGGLLQSSNRSFSGVITLDCLTSTTCPANTNYLLTIQH